MGLPHRKRPPRAPPRGSELPLRPLPHSDLRLHGAGIGAGLLWGAGGVWGGINGAGTPNKRPPQPPISSTVALWKGSADWLRVRSVGLGGLEGGGGDPSSDPQIGTPPPDPKRPPTPYLPYRGALPHRSNGVRGRFGEVDGSGEPHI